MERIRVVNLRSGCWDDAALEQQLDGRLAVAETAGVAAFSRPPAALVKELRMRIKQHFELREVTSSSGIAQRRDPPLRSSWPLPGATGLVRPQCRLLFSRDKDHRSAKGASSPRKGQKST